MFTKEYLKKMAQIHKSTPIKMSEEVLLFQRYLRLNKKLAYSKNEKKQRRIVENIYKR